MNVRSLQLLACVLLASCAAELGADASATPEQAAVLDAALWEWEGRFGAAPACDRALVSWRTYDRAGVNRWCGQRFDGCTLPYRDGRVRLIVLDTPSASWRLTIEAHEAAHWLLRCSGRRPEGDPEHTDIDVWQGQVSATIEAVKSQGFPEVVK